METLYHKTSELTKYPQRTIFIPQMSKFFPHRCWNKHTHKQGKWKSLKFQSEWILGLSNPRSRDHSRL